MYANTCLVYADDKVVDRTMSVKAEAVAVDTRLAPLKKRVSLKKRANIHFRRCDLELIWMGTRFFPLMSGSMRKLNERGIRLREMLKKERLKVIETLARAQDRLNIPRKKDSLEKLGRELENLEARELSDSMTRDELGIVTCAPAGEMCLEGKHLAMGNPEEITDDSTQAIALRLYSCF